MVNKLSNIESKVYLVGYTNPNWDGIYQYLIDIDGDDFYPTLESHLYPVEVGIVVAGKMCYKSWNDKLNPNISRIREDIKEYLENIIKKRDGSVLSHVSLSFILHDVSRILTHELVRNAVGVAISQESMRFMRLKDIRIWVPVMTKYVPEYVWETFLAKAYSGVALIEEALQYIDEWMESTNLNFAVKKIVTSAIRRFIPMGVVTEMYWTANLRALRWIIEQRTAPEAEIEIRILMDKIANIVDNAAPNIMSDFQRTNDGQWIPKYSKV